MPSSSDPLRRRGYIHFDEPPDRASLESMVSNAAVVARWQFMPLLSVVVKTKKIKAKDKASGTFEIKEKERLICYASHRDAALYGYYSSKLSDAYESVLTASELSDVVTAFRPASGRCNIHFAVEAFKWIAGNPPCVALAYDITGFFDNLDHALLRKQICGVLSLETLPADYFAIFKSLTRFVRVDRDSAYKAFGISRHNPRALQRKRICTADDFRSQIVASGLLKKHKGTAGIPQGTPISALLSNIYLLGFDRAINAQVTAWGGLYRRYCDDILCIVPPQHQTDAAKLIEDEIGKVKLAIQPDKQGVYYFDGSKLLSPPLQYLGLTFDGSTTRLRVGGIAKHYSRMRGGVRSAAASRDRVAAEVGKLPKDVPIKEGKLLGRYTYAGKRNFVTYALRASKIVDSKAIKRQISRHVPALKAAIQSKDGT